MARIRPQFEIIDERPVPEIRNFTVATAKTVLGSDGFGFSVQAAGSSVVRFAHTFSIPAPISLNEVLDTTGFDIGYWNIGAVNYFGILHWDRGPGVDVVKIVMADDGSFALTTIASYLEYADFTHNGIINFGLGLQQYGQPIDLLILRRGFDNSGSPFAYAGASGAMLSLDYTSDPGASLKDLPAGSTLGWQHFAAGIPQCILHLENLVNSTVRLSFIENVPGVTYFAFDTTGWAAGLESNTDFWDPSHGCGLIVLDWAGNERARYNWNSDFQTGDVIDLTLIVQTLSGPVLGLQILRYAFIDGIDQYFVDSPAFGLAETEAYVSDEIDPDNTEFFGIQPLFINGVSRPCGFGFISMPDLMRFVLTNRYNWSGGRYVEPS